MRPFFLAFKQIHKCECGELWMNMRSINNVDEIVQRFSLFRTSKVK